MPPSRTPAHQASVDTHEVTTAALAEQLLRAQTAEHLAVEAQHKVTDGVLSLYERLKTQRASCPSHDPRIPILDEILAELGSIVGLDKATSDSSNPDLSTP